MGGFESFEIKVAVTHTHTHTHVYLHTNTHAHTHTRTHTRTHTYTHTHSHTQFHTHPHTYTHTRKPGWLTFPQRKLRRDFPTNEPYGVGSLHSLKREFEFIFFVSFSLSLHVDAHH